MLGFPLEPPAAPALPDPSPVARRIAAPCSGRPPGRSGAYGGNLSGPCRPIRYASARGADGNAIVSLDDVNGGPADTLTPRIVYQVSGGAVHLRLRMVQNGKTLGEDSLDLSTNEHDRGTLAQIVAAKLASMATQAAPPANPDSP